MRRSSGWEADKPSVPYVALPRDKQQTRKNPPISTLAQAPRRTPRGRFES